MDSPNALNTSKIQPSSWLRGWGTKSISVAISPFLVDILVDRGLDKLVDMVQDS